MRHLPLTLLLASGCASLSAYDEPLTTPTNDTGVIDPGPGTGTGTATGTATATGGTGTGTGTATGATGTATGATGTATGGTGSGTGGTWSTGTGTATGATGTATGATTGTGTGATTGTGTGGTGTGTGGTTTTLPTGPLVDGTYVGSISIFYELLVPLIGGANTCNGDITIVVDQAAAVPITGTFTDCAFGPFAFIVAGVGPVSGSFEGYNPVYGVVSGTVVGGDTSGTFDLDYEPWSGTVTTGPRIVGTFSGNNIFYDRWDGAFDVTWVSP